MGYGRFTGIIMDKQWYVIHAYSGYETKVREALLERIERLGMSDFFGEIMVFTLVRKIVFPNSLCGRMERKHR